MKAAFCSGKPHLQLQLRLRDALPRRNHQLQPDQPLSGTHQIRGKFQPSNHRDINKWCPICSVMLLDGITIIRHR